MRQLAAAFLALVVGCDGDSRFFGRIDPQRPTDELAFNLGAEPEYLDPGLASESSGSVLVRNTFSGLVQVHPQTLEPMPDIAERWEVSDDGRRYTFYLRESTWSDGHPLTAHDFEWSFKRVLDPATSSKYASFAYSLENGAAFHQQALLLTGVPESITVAGLRDALSKVVTIERVEATRWPEPGYFVYVGGDPGEKATLRSRLSAHLSSAPLLGSRVRSRAADARMVGVRATADHTLEVRLSDPLPFFLGQLTFGTFRPVPRHVLERLAAEGKNPALWTRAENFVSNGAYVIDEWRFRQHYVLVRNERYWDAARVRLRRARALIVENANTTLNLYRTGDIDWLGQNGAVPNEFVDTLRKFDDFHASPYLAVYFYWFNTHAPPVDDIRVRRALSLAVDRLSLTRYVTRGGQIPLASLVPNGTAGYEGPRPPLFDPVQARRLLADAGYPNGQGLGEITLRYNTAEGHKQIAEALQQMWREHLGVAVTLENQEWKVFLKSMESMDFQMGRMGWVGDYNDPYTFLQLLSSHNGNNHSGWASPEYDALLRTANQTADPSARLGLLREAEERVLDDLPILPIYVYSRVDLVKPYVRGYWGNIQNIHPLKWMWIDERFSADIPADWAPEDPPPAMLTR